jgi:hypothetical protein
MTMGQAASERHIVVEADILFEKEEKKKPLQACIYLQRTKCVQ